ncbi:MAG: hypothetical protein JEY99_21510 [Spirochaetales bacterium]|nr:hypothetical protein [Spirochaetales bacterium]
MEQIVERHASRLILLGGFLGAGKTTFMLRLAGILTGEGNTVALITNDQGEQLVDSEFARAAGYEVGEVSGSCFCCNFSEFINNIDAIILKVNPDYIIAEPVGSCTDLVSTVIAPLEKFHRRKAVLHSFLVLADGLRFAGEYGYQDLDEKETAGSVLLSHQIKEAPVVLINKCDLLTEAQKASAFKSLERLNSSARFILLSASTGEGFEEVMRLLRGDPMDTHSLTSVDIDYDVYAKAEAEYGWYNGSWDLKFSKPEDPSALGIFIMQSFYNLDLNEVAHAKIQLLTELGSMKISFVMGVIRADESAMLIPESDSISVLLNIRAKTSPQNIEDHVAELLEGIGREFQCETENYKCNSLIPGAPKPTYRF